MLVTASVSGTPTSEATTLLTLKNYVLGGNAATATKLAAPVTINGVSFDGSSNITITATVATATTATKLATPTLINGVSFDGSASSYTIPITSLAWSALTSVPTTIAGFGITDAVSLTNTATLTNKTLTQPIISSISNSGLLTLPTTTDTLVGRSTTDTLTNKTINGSNNTLTNIPNSALTNNSVTINGTTVALGGSATISLADQYSLTIGNGLTSTSSTFNGTAAVTFYLTASSSSQLGGVLIPAVATSGITNSNGTIGLAQATSSQIGAVKVDGTSITASAGVITANAGALSGTTLNSTVVSSSLTSFGSSPTLSSPVVTTGVTTSSTTFSLYNTTATTINAFGAATTISIGASTGGGNSRGGVTTINNDLTVSGNLTINGTTTTTNTETVTSINSTGAIGANSSLGITTNQTIIPLLNTTATTINFGGAATALNIGASTGTTTVNNGLTVTGTATLNGSTSVNGNMTYATSTQIAGDFDNATVNSRTVFTTKTTNANPGVYVVPNGTATAASWQAANSSNLTNASKILIATNGTTDVQLVSGVNGSGTYLPLSFYNGGSQQMQLSTTGVLNFTNPTLTTASTGTATIFNTSATTINAYGAATTINEGAPGVTYYVGQSTGNSTFSVLGNTSSGTATVTTNVTTGTVNLFSGVTGTVNIGNTGSTTNFAGTIKQNGVVVPNLTTVLAYQLAL